MDSDHNVRAAGFWENDFVWEGIEDIMARCIIAVRTKIREEMQLVLVQNTNSSYDRNYPRALS